MDQGIPGHDIAGVEQGGDACDGQIQWDYRGNKKDSFHNRITNLGTIQRRRVKEDGERAHEGKSGRNKRRRGRLLEKI